MSFVLLERLVHTSLPILDFPDLSILTIKNMRCKLKKKLQEAFRPAYLEVIDESHLHIAHQSGFDGSFSTHLRIKIAAAIFTGRNRVQCHRMIHEVAADELSGGLHALAIEAKGAEET